jgi:formylglycine-generating enzyme
MLYFFRLYTTSFHNSGIPVFNMNILPVTTALLLALTVAQKGFAQAAADDSCLNETATQVWINEAEFIMGDNALYQEEGPAHKVSLDGFWIDAHEVSNSQFAAFVEATGYLTVAERTPNPADWPADVPENFLKPGSVLFTPPEPGQAATNWWSWVPGTNWRHPDGPNSSIRGKDNYPVVHVAYEDAQAFANWAGRSLPTEAQFELAALGRRNAVFPWGGNELAPHGQHQANTWQGSFPQHNSAEDGHHGLAPVGCFGANDYGAYDLIGNVWEWTSNWYYPEHNKHDSDNPTGPTLEQSINTAASAVPEKVIKGGSYLCAENYCLRFRPAAREAQDTGLGTSHIGFRTVKN